MLNDGAAPLATSTGWTLKLLMPVPVVRAQLCGVQGTCADAGGLEVGCVGRRGACRICAKALEVVTVTPASPVARTRRAAAVRLRGGWTGCIRFPLAELLRTYGCARATPWEDPNAGQDPRG